MPRGEGQGEEVALWAYFVTPCPGRYVPQKQLPQAYTGLLCVTQSKVGRHPLSAQWKCAFLQGWVSQPQERNSIASVRPCTFGCSWVSSSYLWASMYRLCWHQFTSSEGRFWRALSVTWLEFGRSLVESRSHWRLLRRGKTVKRVTLQRGKPPRVVYCWQLRFMQIRSNQA